MSESARFRSGEWIRFSRDDRAETVVDVELDGLLRDMGRRGGVILDRESLTAMVQSVLGADTDLEDMRAADLVRKVSRVRVRLQGMTIPVGRRALRRVLQHVAASDTPLEELPISEVVDRVEGLELTRVGAPGWFDEPTVVALLGRGLGKFQRAERPADPQRERRLALRRQYDAAVTAARQVQREVAGVRDGEAQIYDRSYEILAAAGQLEAVPLLELHVELEQELERTHAPSLTLAERIASRLQSRRRIFGEELAALVFSREEAIERYEIDRLALEANPELSERQKARQLRARREALKVELAKQGIYVGFPDEYRGRRTANAAGPETAAEPLEAASQNEVQR